MENTTNTGPNYIVNYNPCQLMLAMDLSLEIDENDPVMSFVEVMKGVNLGKYVKAVTSNNTHSHNRRMLLTVLLFAYQENIRSLDKIAQLCRHDIRFIWLSNGEKPSKMAFSRLLSLLTDTIDNIFFEINKYLIGDIQINDDIQFIDGTKIEANANKNSFVYKKRIMNSRNDLFDKITNAIHRVNFEYGYNYPINYVYDSKELGYIAQYLMEVMVVGGITPVYGKGQRKSMIQRDYDEILSYYIKLMEYEYWLDVIGDRNSCSKVDHDATFMATKWDYYNQSGITRPCYNAQIAVSDGVIVNADLFQNPADTNTYIPFMERYNEHMGKRPKYPMADAAYGTYANYMYNIKHGVELIQKYSMYNKKNDPKFKKNKYNSLNWEVNEEGYKICPNNRVFDVFLKERYEQSGKELQVKHIYTEKDKCENCPFIKACTKGEFRTISKNVVHEEMQAEVDKNLSEDFGIWLKKQRCAQVEGVFGSLKENAKFTRFTRRGMKNVKTEFLLVCIGHNLRKFHQYRMEKIERPSKKWELS